MVKFNFGVGLEFIFILNIFKEFVYFFFFKNVNNFIEGVEIFVDINKNENYLILNNGNFYILVVDDELINI